MRNLLLSTAMLTLLVSPALAWNNTNKGNHNQIVDGGPGAQANSSAKASARAQARSTSTSTSNSISGGGSANATGGSVVVSGSSSGGGGIGGYGAFVPDGTGQAPCGGGIGLGGAGLTGGGGGGGTLWEFSDCKRMRESTALRAIAHETHDPRIEQAALNEMCQIDRVKKAFGGTCPTIGASVAVDVDAGKNDYCFTRNAGDLNQHRECDSVRRSVQPFPADKG